MIIYYKGIDEVAIQSPGELGGLRSPEFLALNPQGKMPLLVTEEGTAIYESDTIARYLLDRFSGVGDSLIGDTLELRTLSDSISRHHDMYMQVSTGVPREPC